MSSFIKQHEGDAGEKKPGLKLKVLGIGGAGCRIAEHLKNTGLGGDVEFFAINADMQALNDCSITSKFALGNKLTGGLGTGGDPERGRAAAMEDIEEIESICKGGDIVFILAGLGGGTGTGAAPLIAATAKKVGALVLPFVTMPFDCEGERRGEQATAGLHDLQKASDGVICLPNQTVFKLINDDTTLIETLKTTNEYVAKGIRAIWKLVNEAGLINIDFADLCSLVRGRESTSYFATVEASGPQRVREAVDRLLAHPLLGEGSVLANAEAVLVSLSGSSSLSMSEVDRLMELLGRSCEKAEIRLGATIDDSLGDRITLTVIAATKAESVAPTEMESADTGSRLAGVASGLGIKIFTGASGEKGARHTDADEAVSTAAPVRAWRRRRNRSINHPMLPLDMIPKTPFEKAEPTVHNGQDLDVPTFVRRGMILN